MKNSRFLSVVDLCAAAFTAQAQPAAAMPAGHAGMGHGTGDKAADSTRAFQQGEEKMMKDMSQPYTGNADKDFVARMIPHHEGAVQMAEVQLKYGKDPELRKMARDIVKAQQQEIAFMKKWQARHGAR